MTYEKQETTAKRKKKITFIQCPAENVILVMKIQMRYNYLFLTITTQILETCPRKNIKMKRKT